MASWYAQNGCVNVDELPPFWFILFSVCLQVIWTVIQFGSGPSTNVIVKLGKNAISIFTILFVIVIGIMDAVECVEWI